MPLSVDLPQFAVLFRLSDDLDIASTSASESQDNRLLLARLAVFGLHLLALQDALFGETKASLVRERGAVLIAERRGLENGFEKLKG